jgi:hypothetical protein
MILNALTADDRLEIHELYTRYSLAEEAGDVDGVLALFTEDCSVESPVMTFQGKEQLRKLTLGRSIMLKKHNARQVNFSFTMTAEESDRVRSQGSFFVVSYIDNPKIVATGSYNDILSKENGLWKFTQRKIEFKAGPEISDVLHS